MWTKQPARTVGVNRNNPLTRGLTHLWGTWAGNYGIGDACTGKIGTFGVATAGSSPSGNYWKPLAGTGQYVLCDYTGTGTYASVAIAVGNSAGSGGIGGSGAAWSVFSRLKFGDLVTAGALYSSDYYSNLSIRTSNNKFDMVQPGVADYGTFSGTLPDTKWHDICITYNGATAALYIDGVASGTLTFSTTFAWTGNQYTLCYSSDSNQALPIGSGIGVFGTYSRVLATSEISALHSNPWQLYTAPLPAVRRQYYAVYTPAPPGVTAHNLPLLGVGP